MMMVAERNILGVMLFWGRDEGLVDWIGRCEEPRGPDGAAANPPQLESSQPSLEGLNGRLRNQLKRDNCPDYNTSQCFQTSGCEKHCEV